MQIKYDKHPELWKKISSNNEPSSEKSWLDKSSLDYWRHNRIRNSIKALITNTKNKKWITIGDGRFGTDANFLLTSGCSNVTATDISEELLAIGARKKFITRYAAQNAEKITYKDDSFDYALCKEAYHHFPRPVIALYEMLRISKYGIVLIEPNDQANIQIPFINSFTQKHQFESIGNYVYSLSRHEIEKIMLGIGLRFYAFKGVNDYYIEGIEDCPQKNGSFKQHLNRLKLKTIIWVKDVLPSLHLKNSNLISIIIFKQEPQAKLLSSLIKDGFKFKTLPLNPYAQ